MPKEVNRFASDKGVMMNLPDAYDKMWLTLNLLWSSIICHRSLLLYCDPYLRMRYLCIWLSDVNFRIMVIKLTSFPH